MAINTSQNIFAFWFKGLFCLCLTMALAYGLRMLEWPSWQNPEYRLGNEMLLATHDAYHWVAGAEGFGLAVNHPMAVMLRWMANLCGAAPAAVAFWFPAVLASMVAGMVYLWAFALGSMPVGIAAGLIASMAPGFLGRTLLGFYDTDLVTLFFPLLIAIAPACWAMRFMLLPRIALARANRKLFNLKLKGKIFNTFFHREKTSPLADPSPSFAPLGNPLALLWVVLLGLSGLLSWWTQEWHSVFPYIIRYNAALLFIMSACLAPRGRRGLLTLGSLAYALPALAGLAGLPLPLLLLLAAKSRKTRKILFSTTVIAILCLVCLFFFARGEIFDTLLRQINAYLKHSGDSHASGGVSLVFPSVAQSIIEVQDLTFAALFPYFHPWLEAAIFGVAGFVIVIFKRPGALFLLPLMALGLLSSRLGGRMVMFGAPIVALGICLPCNWLFCRLMPGKPRLSGWIACAGLCALLVAPFMNLVPALSQGPIINRRHAEALAQAGKITPPDAMLWLWWDWGYAAQYFARRNTIADGARHGGPSLYLPAAVFATDNPRFARQIIRYAASKGDEPGNFFKGMGPDQAQELINRLRSTDTPLIHGNGRQFVIVSFEMLKLGFWISNFGNWNFVTRQGEGGALSIVPQALAYKLKDGEVRLDGGSSVIFPTSINVFDETGVVIRNYVQEWFDAHPKATPAEQQNFLATRRNINFLFNRVTGEKLAEDQGIYNSLMTQLLLCDHLDPRVAPYFRLVYDNVFARIYEVLPPND